MRSRPSSVPSAQTWPARPWCYSSRGSATSSTTRASRTPAGRVRGCRARRSASSTRPSSGSWCMRDALAQIAAAADVRGGSDTLLVGKTETYADVITAAWLSWVRRMCICQGQEQNGIRWNSADEFGALGPISSAFPGPPVRSVFDFSFAFRCQPPPSHTWTCT
ncbi:hypothetical protein BC834DRAFT_983756 [Gloeopeniophorella convolvens]|nr:hypothetical protein BC834DRAFT_983756 [Gloeopeniophorella convolvens]